MEELRTYWEVPAVAHFCSLFRAVFKLIDFDIEDFEDALIVDTECAAEGGRSSLIVDVLTALLRGCLGRRDVTLLNYNQFLHDLLSIRWVRTGFGQNPLGEDRNLACFHILPLYAKVKVLHCLCEWRLERPDVEVLTRDLNGDTLRVVPLGHDHRGSTYWYFYGTRLYREDPVAQQKTGKRSRVNDQDNTGTDKAVRRGRRKRRRRNYDFSTKKAKSSPKKRCHSSTSSLDSVDGASSEKNSKVKEELNEETVGTGEQSTQNAFTERNEQRIKEENGAESYAKLMRWKPKLEPDFLGETASGSSSFPATPTSAYSNTVNSLTALPSTSQQEDTAASFSDLVNRIYSRDEDDEDFGDEKSERRCASELATSENQASSVRSESAAPDETVQREIGKCEYSESKRPYIPEGPPPWDQAELRPCDPAMSGWSLVCSTLEDWSNLVDSFGTPTDRNDITLCEVLRRDFLPAMKDLFDQKETERMNKIAELAPRRSSDRLEVKRLQKEREEKILAEREREERDRLVKVDDERQRRLDQEKREQRARLRQLEREKRQLIKERAREERSRRLELRQMRQKLIAEGKEIPEDLLNATGGMNYANEQELNELDIEIELEHMYGQLEKLLDQLKEGEDAEPFLEPVKEEIAPDYYQVIEIPMDFTKMEDKLLHREYKNKAEFVQDINLILLNCLRYNGLQSDYTKIAQRLERAFIKAWKRFFPPADLEDSGEEARQEELHCISLLGALDKKIKEEVAMRQRVEQEQKSISVVDKKELARQRKREADRRRRRLKAEVKRTQQATYQEQLASQSLSTLTGLSEPPKRQLPAPFLVGNSSMRRPSGPMPARGPDGRFLPTSPTPSDEQPTLNSLSRLTPVPRTGLTTYVPGITTTPRLPPPVGLVNRRVLPAAPSTLRPVSQSSVNHQMAPITVHSSGASTKVINVPETATLSSKPLPPYARQVRVRPGVPAATASAGGIPSINKTPLLSALPASTGAVKQDAQLRPPGNGIPSNSGTTSRLLRVTAPNGQPTATPTTSRLIPAKTAVANTTQAAVGGSTPSGSTFLLNTAGGTRLVRLVAQDGQTATTSAPTRLIPAKTAAVTSESVSVANSTSGTSVALQWTVHPVIFLRTDPL